jgi:hypothetical protein
MSRARKRRKFSIIDLFFSRVERPERRKGRKRPQERFDRNTGRNGQAAKAVAEGACQTAKVRMKKQRTFTPICFPARVCGSVEASLGRLQGASTTMGELQMTLRERGSGSGRKKTTKMSETVEHPSRLNVCSAWKCRKASRAFRLVL